MHFSSPTFLNFRESLFWSPLQELARSTHTFYSSGLQTTWPYDGCNADPVKRKLASKKACVVNLRLIHLLVYVCVLFCPEINNPLANVYQEALLFTFLIFSSRKLTLYCSLTFFHWPFNFARDSTYSRNRKISKEIRFEEFLLSYEDNNI